MAVNYEIRAARIEDISSLVELCKEHAAFEQAEYAENGQAARLTGALFGADKQVFCLVVVTPDGELAGYATYMPQYATWDANHYMHLDCLYLRPEMRNRGIGKQLVEQIAHEAWALGCVNMQWQTPSFNSRAIAFYERLGATAYSKQRFFLYPKATS